MVFRHFFGAEYPEPSFKVPLLIPLVYTLFLVAVFITPIVKVWFCSGNLCRYFIQNKLMIVGSRSESLNTSCINNMFWFSLRSSQEN